MPEGTVDSAIEARVRRYILDNFGATKESVSLPQRPRPGSAAFDSGVEPIEEDQAIYGSGAAPAAPPAPPAQAPAPTQPLELPPGGMSPDPADQLPDLFPEKAPSTMGEAGAKLADEWGPPPKPYSDYMGRQDTSWGSEETMRAAPAFKQFRQHVDAKIKHLQDYGSAKKVEGLVKALNGWLYDDEPTGPDGQLLPWARSTKDYREALHAFVIHSGFVVEPEKMTDEWLEDMTNFALSSQVRALQEMQNASWKRKGYDVGQPLHPSDWRQATKELKAFRDGREALLQSMYENNPKTLGLLHVMNRFGAGMASIPNAFGAGIELEKLLMNDEDYADFMRTLDIAGEESTATNVLGYGAQTGGMMLALGPLIKGVATGGLMLGMSEKAALQMATPTALFGLATPEAIETGSLKPYAGAAAFAALPYLSPHVQRFLSEKVPFMPAALGHKLGTAISFMAAAHSAQIAQGTPITWEQFRGDIFVSSLIGLMSKYRPPPGKAIKGKRVAAEPWMVDPTGSYSRYPFEGKIGQMPVDAKPGMGAPPRRPGLPEPGPDAVVGAVAPGAQGLGQSRELIAPPMKGRTRAGARVDRGPEPDIEGGVPGTETTWKYPRGDPRARPGGYAYRTGPPVPRYEPAPAPEGMVPRAGMPAAPTQPELPSQAGGPIVIPTSRLKLEAKLRKQSKPQLQNRLRGLKLKIGGNKDDLVTRILDKVEPIPAPTEVAPEPTRAAPAPTPAEPPGPRGGAVSELVQPEGRTQAPAPYEPSTGGIRMGPTAARGPDAERARMGELRRMKRPELENRLRQLGITNFKGRKDQLVRRVRDAEKKLEPPPHKLPKSGRWVAPTGPYSVWPSGTKRATTPNVPTGPTSPYPFEGRIERVPQQQRLGAGKPTPEGELGFDAPRVPKPAAAPEPTPAPKSAAARAAAKPTADRAYVRGKEKVVLVPVSEIHEDPGTFQFKAGMDPKTGVGGKLKDVKEHLTLEGGLSLIWERADGKKFIAEGHQRLGVAKRTGEEAINAVVVREVDGVTARQARGMGALANIANGNGTAIDVARVMTDFGWGKAELEAKSIDTKSKLVRDAMGLQGLSPEALSQVINEVISEAYGGIIGRVLKGQPGKQMEAIKAATKGEGAKNADTVEFLARDIRDAREVTETTTGLFGEEVTVRSTVLERGEVQAKIKKILTDNKGLARKLRGNVKRASAMGTDVDVKGAKAAEAAAGDVLGTIELRSNAGGAVERIISDAGRKVAEGTPVEKAAQEALRRLESVDWKTDTEGGAPGVRPAAGAPRPREAGEGLIPPEVGDAASGVRRPKGESGFMFIPGGRGVSDMMAEVGDFLGKGWWYVGLSNIERMQASKDPMRRMFGKGLEWVNDNAKALTGDQWGMATAREAAVKAARFRVGLKRKFGNALESTGMSHASNVGDVVKSFRAYGAELISGRASTANEFLNNLVYRIRRGLDIGNQQDVELGLKRLTTAGKMELIERIEGGEIDVRYPGRDRVFVLRDPALRRHLGNATYDRMKASGRRVKLDKIQADLKKMAERFERDGSLEMGRIAAEYQRVFEHVPDWLQVNGKRYQINDFNPDSYISNVMGLRAASVRSRNYVFGQGKKGGLPPTLKAIRTSEGMSGKTFKQYMRMSGGMQPVRSWSQAAMEGAPPMVRKFVGGILQVNDALRAAGLSASTISQVAEFPAGRAMTFAGVRRGIPGLGDALKQHGIRAPGIRKLTQAYNKHTAERVGAVMNDVFSPAIEAGRTGGSMMDTAIDTLHAVNLRSGTEQFQARQAVETIGRADLTWQKRAKSGKDYNIEKQSYGQRVLDWSDVLMLQEMGVEGQLARRIVEGKEFGAHTERILRQAATRLTGGGMTPLEEGRFWQTSGMRTLFWYNRYSAMRIMGITKNLEVGLRGMRDAVREPNLTRRQRAARMTAATLRFGYEHATATAQGALQYYFWSMFSPGGTERTKAEFEDDKVAFAFKSWASTVAAGSVGPFFRTIFEREGGPFNINHWLDMVGPVRPAREITNYLQDQSVYRTMESGREKLGGVVKRTLPAARVIDKVTTALTGTKLEKEYALRQEAGRKLITWRFDNDMRPSSAKAGDFLVESQEKLSRLMAETSGDIESGDYNGAIHKVVEALGLPGASITKIRASIRQRLALKDFLPTKNDTDEVATAKLEKLQAYVKARGEKDLMALVRRDVEIEDWLQDLADAFGKRRVRKFRPSRRRR